MTPYHLPVVPVTRPVTRRTTRRRKKAGGSPKSPKDRIFYAVTTLLVIAVVGMALLSMAWLAGIISSIRWG